MFGVALGSWLDSLRDYSSFELLALCFTALLGLGSYWHDRRRLRKLAVRMTRIEAESPAIPNQHERELLKDMPTSSDAKNTDGANAGQVDDNADDSLLTDISPQDASPSTEAPSSPTSGQSSSPEPATETDATAKIIPIREPPPPFEATIPLPLPPTDPVLNDRIRAFQTPSEGLKEFTLFPNLPAELRLRIWFSALEHRRFIRVYTTYPAGIKQRYNVHKGLCDGHESRRFPTTLLAVNCEARCAAREFYRVRLPCVPKEGSSVAEPVLYLNPEWDFVRLFSTKSKAHRPHGVLEFLADVREHDPKGVGVLNLVIGKGMLKDLTKDDCAALKKWDSETKAKMPELLAALRTVYFSQRDRDKSRLEPAVPTPAWGTIPRRSPLQPLFARPTEFHLVGPDPRNVGSALKELWTCDGPRAVAKDWKRLTQYFGVDGEACGTVHRHMISLRPEWKVGGDKGAQWVHDRQDLEELLKVDADRRDRRDLVAPESSETYGFGPGNDMSAPQQRQIVISRWVHSLAAESTTRRIATDECSTAAAAEEEEQAVERVAGFWLLPSEAFGAPVDRQAGMYQWDVSAFTPELGVFKLPEKADVRW